jgi:hypothetical protein
MVMPASAKASTWRLGGLGWSMTLKWSPLLRVLDPHSPVSRVAALSTHTTVASGRTADLTGVRKSWIRASGTLASQNANALAPRARVGCQSKRNDETFTVAALLRVDATGESRDLVVHLDGAIQDRAGEDTAIVLNEFTSIRRTEQPPPAGR